MSSQIDASVAKRFDIIVKQNQTLTMVFNFQNDEGNPLDLTDSIFKMSVRDDGCNNSCGCGDGNFNQVYKQDFTPTLSGNSSIQFAEVIILSPGNYKYDLLAEMPDQGRVYLLQGTFKVKKSYSQITTL